MYEKHDGIEHKGRDRQGRDVWRLRGRVGGSSFDERFHGTKTAARRRLDALRSAAADGTLAESSEQTVDRLVDTYVAHRVSIGKVRPGKSEDTYRRYARLHISPVIGAMRVADVRAGHAQQVLDRMVSAEKATSTVRQVHAIAHGAFRWAVKQRKMPFNPFDAAELPEVNRQQPAAVKAEDVAAILAKVETEYLLAIRLLAGTGMRRGEVCALRWDDLYLDGNHEACSMAGVAHAHVLGTMQRVPTRLRLARLPKRAAARKAHKDASSNPESYVDSRARPRRGRWPNPGQIYLCMSGRRPIPAGASPQVRACLGT